MQIERSEFEAFVERAVLDLPAWVRERLVNVEFFVKDVPDIEELRSSRARGTLLGLYRGVPHRSRHSSYQMTLPDAIVLFQSAIQQLASTEAELYERIRHVVRHEVAHHFGLTDDRLREIDAY